MQLTADPQRKRRNRWLAGAAVLAATFLTPAWSSAACDTEAIRSRAQASFSNYPVQSVRVADGIVTLVLARPDGAPRFGIGVRTEGSLFFTSVMGAHLDADALSERARVSAIVANWYPDAELQRLIQACSATGAPSGDRQAAVREAAADVLSPRLGDTREASLVVAALLISLVLALRRGRTATRATAPPRRMNRFDLGLVLMLSLIAVGIAFAIAWRLSPENDEVVTLGSRQESLASLLSWTVGGEPFNPPGGPFLFGLWLRLADGFFWARVLPMLLIPVTALLAYRAGAAAFGRVAGLAFTAMVVLAPAYLRSAAIARAYALIVLALCAILAAIAGTFVRTGRGAAVGAASLLGIWASYLLWPLAAAAPWLARLAMRDRLRLTAASLLMAAAILPRIRNGFAFSEGMTHTGTLDLPGPIDALGYALARAGQAPPYNYNPVGWLAWLAGALVVALIGAAVIRLRRRAWRQLCYLGMALVLVSGPLLALLSVGRGIRERHVIALQVMLALGAAAGLASLLSAKTPAATRLVGALAVLVLVWLSVDGNRALLSQPDEWLRGVRRITQGADLVMVVPRSAQLPVTAMLTGNSSSASPSVAWPPVCESDSEWWCHRLDDGRRIVAIDDVSDRVIDAAARAARVVWVFDARGQQTYGSIPSRLAACERRFANAIWTVVECAGTGPQQEHAA